MESFLKLAYIEMESFLNLDDAEIKILFNWSLDNLTDINASKVHYDQEVKPVGDNDQENYGELE
jgi:hypothetical protein